MAEYSREQRNQLGRAIANNETGSRQLKEIADNRIHSNRAKQLERNIDKTANVNVLQFENDTDLGEAIVSDIRNAWKIEPGNQSKAIEETNGLSYANRVLFQKLRIKGGYTSMSDDDIKYRAVLARTLQAANCDEYADIAYQELNKRNGGAKIAIEYRTDVSHAYASYDNNVSGDPREDIIVDPWMGWVHEREDLTNYKTVVSRIADGKEWYTHERKAAITRLNPETYNKNKDIIKAKSYIKKKKQRKTLPKMDFVIY